MICSTYHKTSLLVIYCSSSLLTDHWLKHCRQIPCEAWQRGLRVLSQRDAPEAKGSWVMVMTLWWPARWFLGTAWCFLICFDVGILFDDLWGAVEFERFLRGLDGYLLSCIILVGDMFPSLVVSINDCGRWNYYHSMFDYYWWWLTCHCFCYWLLLSINVFDCFTVPVRVVCLWFIYWRPIVSYPFP